MKGTVPAPGSSPRESEALSAAVGTGRSRTKLAFPIPWLQEIF